MFAKLDTRDWGGYFSEENFEVKSHDRKPLAARRLWEILWRLHREISAKSKEIWKGKQLGEIVEPVVEQIMAVHSDYKLTRDALRYALCCIPGISSYIYRFGTSIKIMFDNIEKTDWSMTPHPPL